MNSSVPASFTTSDPRRAKPSANAALSVNVNSLGRDELWRGTRNGIIAASAGAKNVVTVETTMFRRRCREVVAGDETSRTGSPAGGS